MSQEAQFDPKAGRRKEHPLHVLFVGAQMSRTHQYFKRADELVRCEYAEDLKTAVDMIVMQARARRFDCVIFDMRRPADGSIANLAAIASMKAVGTFAVMVVPSQAEAFEAIDGIDEVLINPVDRNQIITTVINSVTPRTEGQPEFIQIPRGFSSSGRLSDTGDLAANASAADEWADTEFDMQDIDRLAEMHDRKGLSDDQLIERMSVHGQIRRAKSVLEELSARHAPTGAEITETAQEEQTASSALTDRAVVADDEAAASAADVDASASNNKSDDVGPVHTDESTPVQAAPDGVIPGDVAPVAETVAIDKETVEEVAEAATEAVRSTDEVVVEPVVPTGDMNNKAAQADAVRPLATEPEKIQKVDAGESPAASPVEAVKRAVTKGFESSLSKIQDADQSVWQRFVPLANFIYKKLAIIVLTGLFLAFLSYGAMIVFFMGSSSWSLPFELSRGHALVEKVDRDLSSMSLRRNEVRQDKTIAMAERVKAEREYRDGQLQLTLTRRTIEEEIISQTATQLEITQHIDRLKRVINDFNALNGKGGFAKNLEGAYDQRLITRKSLNSGTLALLETLHRMATVQNEISVKELELRRVDRRLEFLRSLLEEIDQPEIRVITSAGSDLAHLAREVIEAKNRIASAQKAMDTADKRVNRLDDSLRVITANIRALEATPAARARTAPVMVLFVPYTNSANVTPGEPLYRCALSIVFCGKVGEVGEIIDGETTAVHPLFGKPMRGSFVEAKFNKANAVREELVHAGRPPILF